jgi:hypothetical protein
MSRVDDFQVRLIEAALDPARAFAARIALQVQGVIVLTVDQRAALVDAIAPLLHEVLEQQEREIRLCSLAPEHERLLPLLEHAVVQADSWHNAACDCGSEHGELMPECRATVHAWRIMQSATRKG